MRVVFRLMVALMLRVPRTEGNGPDTLGHDKPNE